MKKKYPKYPGGGEFGNILKNSGRLYGDTFLSAVGAGNVIQDTDYEGKSAQDFAKVSSVTGGIAKAALPIAGAAIGGTLGGPMGAKAGMGIAKGVQGIGSQFNPQDPNAQQQQPYPQQQQQGMNPNQMMQMANTGMQIYNMGSSMGAFRNGGIQQYPDGGVVNDGNTGVNKYKKIYTEKELKEIQKRDALQKQKTSEFDKNIKLGNTVVAIPSNKGYDYPDSTYYYPNSKTGVGSPYITTTLGARLLGIGDANIQEKLKYSDVPYNIRQDSTEYNANNFSQGGMMGNGVIHAPELGGYFRKRK